MPVWAGSSANWWRGCRPASGRHVIVTVPVDGLEAALRACRAPAVHDGRRLDDDLAYFSAAAAVLAAGEYAGCLLHLWLQPC